MTVVRAAGLSVGLALLALPSLFIVAAVLGGPAAATPSSGYKIYYLHLIARGEGYAHAKGAKPIQDGGIDTASGEVRSKFYGRGLLRIRINPSTGKVALPYPKPGYISVPLDSQYSQVSGTWGGIIGDTPDATGQYECSYGAHSSAFKNLRLVWTYAGVPKAGKVPIAVGLNQPQASAPANPTVRCSGYKTDHAFPGAGTVGEGAFMSLVGGAPKVSLSVKKLLSSLHHRSDFDLVTYGPKIDTGSCTGCPLPMRPEDGSSLELTVVGELSTLP